MNEMPRNRWWGGAMLLLATAALSQLDCSSSSSRGGGLGGMGAGVGGTASSSGGSSSGTGGSVPGECDGSYVATGDACADAEQMYYACCIEEDFGSCDSTSQLETCWAACLLASSCAELRAAVVTGTPSDTLLACMSVCAEAVDQFTCDDGTETIPMDWVCDGEPDCSDGSDELPDYCAP